LGLKGDHQTLGLDFNIDLLFWQQVTATMHIKQWGVNSNNMKLTEKFCKGAILACQESDIFNHIHALTSHQELTNQDHQTLETLDSELTKILTSAN